MMRSFCEAAAFKSLIHNQRFPQGLDQLTALLEKKISTHYNGRLDADSPRSFNNWNATLYDLDTPSHHRLNEAERAAIVSAFPTFLGATNYACSQLLHQRATYAPISMRDLGRDKGGKNSSIIFKYAQERYFGRIIRIVCDSSVNPASATKIGLGPQASVVIVIEKYRTLTEVDMEQDPYLQFPELDCRLVYKSFGTPPTLLAISYTDIIAHVARCPFVDAENRLSEECLVLLSLDRVGTKST
jgi:hypothetical protein